MLFCGKFLFFLFYFSLSCNALQCTTNCSFTSSLTASFNIPDRCNQKISAGTCLASLHFWFERGEYDVSFRVDSDLSNTLLSIRNNRFVLLEFSTTVLTFFAYTIERACKNKDDCARDLVTNEANEMLQRQYNYSAIMDGVEPLVLGPPLTLDNPILNCYDSNQNVHQCGTTTQPGTCVISDTISKKKTSIECDTKLLVGNTYVSIYQSDSDFATFDVYCNRSLCNTQSALQAAKELMFKHNVTKTLDGRLDGSRLIISISLMIVTIFILFFNQF